MQDQHQLKPQELQQVNLAIQAANTISHSLLFSLGRQYLDQPFKQSEYIQYFPSKDPLIGKLYFLQLQQLDDAKVNSLEQQLTALQVSLSACHNLGGDKLVFMINSDGSKNSVYLGTRSRNSDFIDNLQAMLEGNLLGTQLKLSESTTDIEKSLNRVIYPTAITGIPTLNPGINLGYSQIDRLMRSLHGSPFTYMVIAEPILETEINEIIYRLRELLGMVYSLSKVTLDESFTKTIFEQSQQTNTTSHNSSNSSTSSGIFTDSSQNAETLIKLVSLGLEKIYPPYELAIKIGQIASEHIIPGMLKKWSETSSQASIKEIINTSDTQTTGISKSTAQTLKGQYINAHAQGAETHIKQYIERFEQARALGCWNVGIYFLSENEKIAQRGANSLKGMFSGEKSIFEPLRVHKLYEYHSDLCDGTLKDLGYFRQPNLALIDPKNPQQPLDHPLDSAFNRLTTPLNTQELSALINLPRIDV